MSLNRLRKLSGLNETITDNFELNNDIERRLETLPQEIRTSVLDALEVLQAAGENGLSVSEWATKIREINSSDDMPMAEVLKTTVTNFPFVVKRLRPKHYAWVVAQSDPSEVQPDSMFSQAAHSMIGLKNDAFAFIKEKGHFTLQDLRTHLLRLGYLQPVVGPFIENFLQSFNSMFLKTGNVYTYKPEQENTRDNTMQQFRDIVKRNGT